MSGSSGGGNDVKITIGADASQYSEATQAAADASGKLAASLTNVANVVASGRGGIVSAGNNVSGLAKAMLDAGMAAGDVAKALGFSTTAAAAFGAAMRSAATSGQSFGSLAVPADQAAAAAARLDATIARVMSGLSAVAAPAAAASQAISGIAQTAQQSTGSLDASAAASKRLEDAARRVLASLSPTAIELLRTGTSAAAVAPSFDAAAAGAKRLDDAARRVLAGLSPAEIAMLRTNDAARSTAPSMAAAAAGTERLDAATRQIIAGLTAEQAAMLRASLAADQAATALNASAQSATSTTAAVKSTAEATAATSASVDTFSRSSLQAAAATAAISAPLKSLSFDYKDLAASMLATGLSAKDVAAATGLPIANVNAFAVALDASVKAQRANSDANKEATVATKEATAATEAAARLDATAQRALESLAAGRRQATAATNAATIATKAMGSANQQAGEQLISAGSKYASAGENVTALYHALIAAGDSAETAAAKLGVTIPKLDEVDKAATRGHTSLGGMTREAVVLGRELFTTDISLSRVAGTLAVMAERSGSLMTKVGEMASKLTFFQATGVAAVAAVSAALVAFVAHAVSAAHAIDQVTAAAARMGRSTADAKSDGLALNEQLRQMGGLSSSERQKVVEMGASIAGITREMRAEFVMLTPALKAAYPDEEPEKYFAALVNASKGGVNGVRDYLRESDLLNDTNIRELASAEASNDRLAATRILLRDVRQELQGYAEARAKQIKDNENAFNIAPGAEMPIPVEALPAPKLPQSFKAQDPQSVQDTENEEKLLGTLRERAALEAQIPVLEQRANTATGEANVLAVEALKVARDKLATLKDAGDATWLQKQESALNVILEKVAANAASTKTIALDENRARIAFWDEQVAHAGLTEGQINAAQIRASKARQNLSAEELRVRAEGESSWMAAQQLALSEILVKVAANATSSKALMEDENRARIAFWAKAAQQAGLTDKQITEAHAEGNKARLALAGEELRGGESAAKQALAAKLATLSEEQSAHHNDYARVMEIESQKLALLASLGKEGTKQYEMELIKRDELMRAHATQQTEIARETLEKNRSIDAANLAAAKAAMDVEVAARRMSKAEEESALQDFAMRQQAIEIKEQQDFIDGLADQPKAYQAALDKMSQLKAQFAARDAQYNARMVTDQMAAWDRMLAPVESSVGGQVNEVLRGNATIGQAALHATGNIIVAYAEMGAKLAVQAAGRAAIEILWTGTEQSGKTAAMLAGASARSAIVTAETAHENTGVLARLLRWMFGESTKTAVAASGTSARATLRAGETASENLGVFARIGRWLFGETAKTAATASGTASRTGIENASTIGSFLAGIAKRIAGWLGMESAQTAASIAGAGTREGIMTGEQLASMAGQKAFALGQVQTESVVAGAAAFADSAMLGPVGLAAAPEAAAAAAAAVMAMGAGLAVPLAVGAWDLPRDMPANLHAGEMVVPANFASGLRAAFSGGGGGGAANFSYAPTIHAGGGASPVDLDRVLGRSLNAMKSYFWQIGRNGSLTLPGR